MDSIASITAGIVAGTLTVTMAPSARDGACFEITPPPDIEWVTIVRPGYVLVSVRQRVSITREEGKWNIQLDGRCMNDLTS
jgi:hypothetical protein